MRWPLESVLPPPRKAAPEDDTDPAMPAAKFRRVDKADVGKIRYSLLAPGFVRSIVEVLEVGAQKYAPHAWQTVERPRERYYDALCRHVDAWWSGELSDPEDGLHHLAHAACCLMILMWHDSPKESAHGA